MGNQHNERSERFASAVRSLPDKRETIAKKMKYSIGYFAQLMTGHRNASDAVILKFSKCYPQLSYEWLMFGEGEMYKPKAEMREFEFQAITAQFASNMKALREAESLTTGEFAQILNMYEGKVIDIEAGRIGPSLSTLMDLRKLFNIRIDDMMFTDLTGENMQRAHLSYTDEVRAKDMEEILQEVQREIQEIRRDMDSLKNK